MITRQFLDRLQEHCKIVSEKHNCLKCRFPQYCNVISLMKSNYTTLPKEFTDEIKDEIIQFEFDFKMQCESLDPAINGNKKGQYYGKGNYNK